jgi:L-lactate dehydrogenase complex protein LldF
MPKTIHTPRPAVKPGSPKSPIDLYEPYAGRVERALNNPHLRTALNRSTIRLSNQRVAALAAVDGQRLRDQTRQMKEDVLRRLPDLLEQFEANVTANGGQVHWARDAAEANAIVLEIARRTNTQKVVKAKSMATEEIHLNHALEEAGIEPVETDLGEYIIQLANEPPSHIVAPVVHKRLEDIAKLFQEKLDMPPTFDPEVMCSVARMRLRQEFLTAEMGVSGCNFAIAETGTVCIVTNEGNGRMVSSMPNVYVAVMGLEKLVPTVEDAVLQYQALVRSSTGQQCSVYLSMTSGPRKFGDTEGPEEFHVVILDNGRSDMLARGYGEALMCIRCGACLNVCPVYREIGGHAYGSTYSGPIGAVISPLLPAHITNPEKLPHASSLCGACRDACPVKIDLPRLLLDLRADQVEDGDSPWVDGQAMHGFLFAMQDRGRYEQAGKLASFGSNMLASLSGGTIKFLPPPFSAWTNSRDFPPFAKKSFRELWSERLARKKSI